MADEQIPSIPALQPRLKARLIVADYIDNHRDVTDNAPLVDPDKDLYVVWFCKTLQNWKALLSTVFTDGMYYEVTYNGDEKEMYLDAYKKFQNVTYPDSF